MDKKTIQREAAKLQRSVITGRPDPRSKAVVTSERAPPAERLFTAAHELGHWVLHKDEIEHRDRPIDALAPKWS